MNILDFVMVGSDDHEKSGDFYDAVFEPLKLKRVLKTQKYLGYAHSSDPEKVQFYVTHPVNGKDATFGNGTQITLLADNKEASLLSANKVIWVPLPNVASFPFTGCVT